MHRWALLASYAAAVGLVPAPPVVNIVEGRAPGVDPAAMGTAATDPNTSTIYHEGALDPATKAHEVGHLFDSEVLTDGDRHYFQRVMQAPAGAWQSGTGLHGGATSPSEWFADYYQAAALHLDPSKQNEAAYASIGPKRLHRVEAALERLARRRGLTTPYS